MTDAYTNEPMLDMFIFETSQQIEQLEKSILSGEKESSFTQEDINEIFRIMHTIKGSAAMMMFQTISTLAHSMEDIFYYLREEKPKTINYSDLSDLVLEGIDFIKIEIEKIKNQDKLDGDASNIEEACKELLSVLKGDNGAGITISTTEKVSHKKKQYYISPDKEKIKSYDNVFKAIIFFEDGCEMENIRAYTIIHNLKDISQEIVYCPKDILEDDSCVDIIRKEGFLVYIKVDYTYDRMHEFFMKTIFLKDLELVLLESDQEFNTCKLQMEQNDGENTIKVPEIQEKLMEDKECASKNHPVIATQQSIISVSVAKLDKLMDLVGEMVISEAMVIQNPDLIGLELDNFQKAARQLNKITGEMQDMVMSIRMVPLSATFQKMNRIVRDMSKKLRKEINLAMIGEDTEVDKNIIEHISDPLMHLVRNAIDHGIESTKERLAMDKPQAGTVTLEAKNAGSDVLIMVKDDGKGLNKDKILKKAKANGILIKQEEDMTDKEIYNLILLPGFSTNESITEYSGRGVGMDVVSKNIESVGGALSVESIPGQGTTIILKIPLTLAIIDGMNIRVGNARYTIPTTSIKESFRPKVKEIITDPDGNEMIIVRGECHSVLRLHRFHKIDTEITEFSSGIIIMIEQDEKSLCIFADELMGQQQVVVKSLPKYIQEFKRRRGIAGCTLLGDGSISLILDVAGLMNM